MPHELKVPDSDRSPALEPLVTLLRGRRLAVLTGAGISTDSGIPDYRGPETRHLVRTPIQHRDFHDHEHVQKRYWLRSALGWPRMAAATPNAAHRALASLEARGHVIGVVTQNVDGLHHAARSERVVELHGALREVRCLGCGTRERRDSLQPRLLAENPILVELAANHAAARADGDVHVDPALGLEARVVLPRCLACDGSLAPDVVFFGGNVAKPVVDSAFQIVDEADALLVVGTSLTVFSGLRFVRRAAERRRPIAIVTLGETRGDAYASVRLDAPVADVLPELARRL